MDTPRRTEPVNPTTWEVLEVEVQLLLKPHGLGHTLGMAADVKESTECKMAGVIVRHFLHADDVTSVQNCLDVRDVMEALKAKVDRKKLVMGLSAMEDLWKIKLHNFPTAEKFTEVFDG